MGHADEALKTVEGNLAIARERARDPSHLYSYVDALAFAGRVHALLGNSSAVKLLSHELLAISRRNHYAYFEAIGTIQGGWALAKEGSLPLGIRQMREGVAALEQTGTGLGARGFYVQIAEFHVQLGEKQEALAMLDMAEGPPGWGTRVWDAEIERVRGEIAAMSPQADPDAAQASFCKALSIARNQNARTLEVKAVLSYARFLKDQRRRGDAGDALASVLNEYSDTRDFPDLKDARLLLADLSVQA